MIQALYQALQIIQSVKDSMRRHCNGLLKGRFMGVLHLHVRAYAPHCKFLQVLHQCPDDSWPLLRSHFTDLHNLTSFFYRADITVTVAGPSGSPLLKCHKVFGVQLGS